MHRPALVTGRPALIVDVGVPYGASMDFQPSEEMQTMLAMVREFMDSEVIPLEGEMLHGTPETLAEGVAKAQEHVKQMGLWAPNFPVEFGGLGLSLVDHGLLVEQIGRSPLGMTVFGTQAPDAGNIEILHKYGTPEQQETWMRPLVEGTIRKLLLDDRAGDRRLEPDPARHDRGRGRRRLRDQRSEVVHVLGRRRRSGRGDGDDQPGRSPHQRFSMILVPTDTQGFHLVRNVSVMGHAGSGHASHGEVIYQGCRVPRANLLGPEGHGFIIAQDRLGPGRIHHCMRWLGIASRAFDMMCERANARTIDLDGNTLADRQVIQHWAAELDAEIRGARLQVLHCASSIDRDGAKAARDEISAIKFVVANTMLKAVDTAIQVHGALGVTDDTVLAHWYRHERAARIYDGADEVHKTSLGRRILRRYANTA